MPDSAAEVGTSASILVCLPSCQDLPGLVRANERVLTVSCECVTLSVEMC